MVESWLRNLLLLRRSVQSLLPIVFGSMWQAIPLLTSSSSQAHCIVARSSSVALATAIAGIVPVATARTAAAAALVLRRVAAAVLVHLRSVPRLCLGILLHHVDDFVRNTQILDGTATNVAFRHSPKSVAILQGEVMA